MVKSPDYNIVYKELVKYNVIDSKKIKCVEDLRYFLQQGRYRKRDDALVIPEPKKFAKILIEKSSDCRKDILDNSDLTIDTKEVKNYYREINYKNKKGKEIKYHRIFHMLNNKFISNKEYERRRFDGVYLDKDNNERSNPFKF